MSQKNQDWFRGSFAAWLCAILLTLISWNFSKLHDKVEKLSDDLVHDREQMIKIITTERERISENTVKIDGLVRSIEEIKQTQRRP